MHFTMLLLSRAICIIYLLHVWSTSGFEWHKKVEEKNDTCFCHDCMDFHVKFNTHALSQYTGICSNEYLSGQIDDCCCSVEDVQKLNIHIYPRLSNIIERNYFRYVKLNLKKTCPFWQDWNQCAVKDCSVDKCSEEELPEGLKEVKTKGESVIKDVKAEQMQDASDDEEENGPCAVDDEGLGEIDHNISDLQRKSLDKWSNYDAETYCIDLDEDSIDAKWVDLILNPEKFTGYTGAGANRIWMSIYKENCFFPEVRMRTFDELNNIFLSKTCLEKRVFYRTMSGLHASINIDLTYNSLITDPRFPSTPQWGPDLEDFEKRFDPEITKGNGPHWLKNVYFTFLLTLRAVTKATPYWQEVKFYTGNTKEDQEVKQIVLELIKSAKSCPSTFDETQMFTGEKAQKLKDEFKLHFQNVSRIMDCVGCEKCRMWGKLQITGLGTAMKILFSSDKWDTVPVINGEKFSLTRTEIVALFNALNKFSHSVHYIGEFKKMREKLNNGSAKHRKKTNFEL